MPLYIFAQLLGSILASGTLALMFDVTHKTYFGTVPVGSNGQSLAVEIVITFLLMFVISAVTTDDRAVNHSFIHICLSIYLSNYSYVYMYVCVSACETFVRNPSVSLISTSLEMGQNEENIRDKYSFTQCLRACLFFCYRSKLCLKVCLTRKNSIITLGSNVFLQFFNRKPNMRLKFSWMKTLCQVLN